MHIPMAHPDGFELSKSKMWRLKILVIWSKHYTLSVFYNNSCVLYYIMEKLSGFVPIGLSKTKQQTVVWKQPFINRQCFVIKLQPLVSSWGNSTNEHWYDYGFLHVAIHQTVIQQGRQPHLKTCFRSFSVTENQVNLQRCVDTNLMVLYKEQERWVLIEKRHRHIIRNCVCVGKTVKNDKVSLSIYILLNLVCLVLMVALYDLVNNWPQRCIAALPHKLALNNERVNHLVVVVKC